MKNIHRFESFGSNSLTEDEFLRIEDIVREIEDDLDITYYEPDLQIDFFNSRGLRYTLCRRTNYMIFILKYDIDNKHPLPWKHNQENVIMNNSCVTMQKFLHSGILSRIRNEDFGVACSDVYTRAGYQINVIIGNISGVDLNIGKNYRQLD